MKIVATKRIVDHVVQVLKVCHPREGATERQTDRRPFRFTLNRYCIFDSLCLDITHGN